MAKFKQYSLILASDFKQKGKKAVGLNLTQRHTAPSTGHDTSAVMLKINLVKIKKQL